MLRKITSSLSRLSLLMVLARVKTQVAILLFLGKSRPENEICLSHEESTARQTHPRQPKFGNCILGSALCSILENPKNKHYV
jgi:hypothetical protein